MRVLWTAVAVFALLYSSSLEAQVTQFQRGDANDDASLDLSDGVFVLLNLFAGGSIPPCLDAADANDSGNVDLSDAVFLFNFLFLGGQSIPEPFVECGVDPTDDDLLCGESVCPQDEPSDLPPSLRNLTDNMEAEVDGDRIIVRADGVPQHSSPYFDRDDSRWEAQLPERIVNPNRIMEQNLVFRIPREPEIAAQPTNTGLGPIGFSVTGVALFNQYAAMFSPLDREIRSFDAGNGHPAGGGLYHYHIEPLYLTLKSKSSIVGVMLDGFPLYGPEEQDGSAPSDLDDCNGHTHATSEYPDGIYHYHVVADPPYLCGCFKGTPGTQSR